MANCHDLFLSFHETITLSGRQKENLRQARDAIRNRIKKKFIEVGRIPAPKFWFQGSFAMHTIVNPLDGEYDIDDGVYLQNLDKTNNRNWPTPETVHKWIFEAVNGHTDQPPIDKRTCVRVIYAGRYHVDLPIYAELNGEKLHAEKGEKGWHKSDPRAITDWFQDAVNKHGEQLSRMVRYFRAWADYNAKDGKLPSGLIFTVLVVEKYQANDRDDVCFGQLVTNLYSRMLASPNIPNPKETSEDLYERYDDTQKRRFLSALRRLKDVATEALSAEGKKDACKKWKSEFGDRWVNCDTLEEKDKPRYTIAPALLRDDARSA